MTMLVARRLNALSMYSRDPIAKLIGASLPVHMISLPPSHQDWRPSGYTDEDRDFHNIGFSLPLIGAEEGTEILGSLYDVPEDVAAFLAAYVDAAR